MRFFICIIVFIGIVFYGYTRNQQYENSVSESNFIIKKTQILQPHLSQFFIENESFESRVDDYVKSLSDEELAGIVLMPAYEKQHTKIDLKKWIQNYHVGGFMILRSDYSLTDASFVEDIETDFPLLISIDAEPSLIEYRIPKLQGIEKTNALTSLEQSSDTAYLISEYISKLGVNINFAPVYDNNSNTSVIGDRSYGSNPHEIHRLASEFSYVSLNNNIIPTAKHFPGHGNVTGDTHKNLQTISGELKELDQFKLAINDDIPMVMVGHLAIDNNDQWETDAIPASLSKKIMTDLLKTKLGFDGLIVTDALNMGALDQFNNVSIRALEAGADIVLLPKNIDQSYQSILSKIKTDQEFKRKILEKAEKIIHMKMILNYIEFKKPN